jgi:hypothetical protein
VAGRIRSPRDKERFFALLQYRNSRNEDPDKAKDKTHFDNLTPLFPIKRFILESKLNDPSARRDGYYLPHRTGDSWSYSRPAPYRQNSPDAKFGQFDINE